MRLALITKRRLAQLAIGAIALINSGCPANKGEPRGPERPNDAGPLATAPSPASVPAAAATAGALAPIECVHRGSGRDFPVGPGKTFSMLGEVPFASLRAGDTVRLHWRPEPYHEKLMIGGGGSADQPIRLCGVPGPEGQLPVIDGEDAMTRHGLEFSYDGHQIRGLIIVGHRHDEPWLFQPHHFVIEGLEIRNASEGLPFSDRHGKASAYSRNAAGIYVQRADYVTIRGCDIHHNQNGLFIGGGGGPEVSHHVRILGNHIHDNGSVSDYYAHNVYNEAVDVLYEANWMQSPRASKDGVLGANIKERSAGVVIRYNWIEDGSHMLDLVDAQEAKRDTVPLPSFHTTYVYGNVFIRGSTASGSMIHYGGDSGQLEDYRKGTLFFFNNTVVIYNRDYPPYALTKVFELSTNDERLVSFNNVYWSEARPSEERPIALLGSRDEVSAGLGSFEADWIADDWQPADARPRVKVTAKVTGFERASRGTDPGFRDQAARDYTPAPASPLRGAGRTPPPELPAEHHVTRQYARHQSGTARKDGGKTLGGLD